MSACHFDYLSFIITGFFFKGRKIVRSAAFFHPSAFGTIVPRRYFAYDSIRIWAVESS